MTDVEKSEILHIWHVCDVENVAIYAKFMRFFAIIYALSRGEKLSPKVHLWRKNDKYQVCVREKRTFISTELLIIILDHVIGSCSQGV